MAVGQREVLGWEACWRPWRSVPRTRCPMVVILKFLVLCSVHRGLLHEVSSPSVRQVCLLLHPACRHRRHSRRQQAPQLLPQRPSPSISPTAPLGSEGQASGWTEQNPPQEATISDTTASNTSTISGSTSRALRNASGTGRVRASGTNSTCSVCVLLSIEQLFCGRPVNTHCWTELVGPTLTELRQHHYYESGHTSYQARLRQLTSIPHRLLACQPARAQRLNLDDTVGRSGINYFRHCALTTSFWSSQSCRRRVVLMPRRSLVTSFLHALAMHVLTH